MSVSATTRWRTRTQCRTWCRKDILSLCRAAAHQGGAARSHVTANELAPTASVAMCRL